MHATKNGRFLVRLFLLAYSAVRSRLLGEDCRDGYNGQRDGRDECVCRQSRYRRTKVRVYDFRHGKHQQLLFFLVFNFFRLESAYQTTLQVEGSRICFGRLNLYFQGQEVQLIVLFYSLNATGKLGLDLKALVGVNLNAVHAVGDFFGGDASQCVFHKTPLFFYLERVYYNTPEPTLSTLFTYKRLLGAFKHFFSFFGKKILHARR